MSSHFQMSHYLICSQFLVHPTVIVQKPRLPWLPDAPDALQDNEVGIHLGWLRPLHCHLGSLEDRQADLQAVSGKNKSQEVPPLVIHVLELSSF